jgi:transcriptional regulator with XRE-family HTH domain
MMVLHKKIRFLRLNKSWSQETMAEKLEMSPNGYGSIERGETNVQLSRVLQIAKLFDINIAELFKDTNGKNVLNSMGNNNIEIQNNHGSNCYFSVTDDNLSQSECQRERQQLEFKLDKQIIIIEQKDKEICFLKKLNELLTTVTAQAAASKLVPYRVHRSRASVLQGQRAEETRKANEQRFKTNLSNC